MKTKQNEIFAAAAFSWDSWSFLRDSESLQGVMIVTSSLEFESYL